MIRVTVELESAVTGQTVMLGQLCIANKGRESSKNLRPGRHNYDVALARRGSPRTGFAQFPTLKNTVAKGSVDDYPRDNYTIWKLVALALKAVLK